MSARGSRSYFLCGHSAECCWEAKNSQRLFIDRVNNADRHAQQSHLHRCENKPNFVCRLKYVFAFAHTTHPHAHARTCVRCCDRAGVRLTLVAVLGLG